MTDRDTTTRTLKRFLLDTSTPLSDPYSISKPYLSKDKFKKRRGQNRLMSRRKRRLLIDWRMFCSVLSFWYCLLK